MLEGRDFASLFGPFVPFIGPLGILTSGYIHKPYSVCSPLGLIPMGILIGKELGLEKI